MAVAVNKYVCGYTFFFSVLAKWRILFAKRRWAAWPFAVHQVTRMFLGLLLGRGFARAHLDLCRGFCKWYSLCCQVSKSLCNSVFSLYYLCISRKSVTMWVMLNSVPQPFWNNFVAGDCTLNIDCSSPTCHFLVTRRERKRLLMVQCECAVSTLKKKRWALPEDRVFPLVSPPINSRTGGVFNKALFTECFRFFSKKREKKTCLALFWLSVCRCQLWSSNVAWSQCGSSLVLVEKGVFEGMWIMPVRKHRTYQAQCPCFRESSVSPFLRW